MYSQYKATYIICFTLVSSLLLNLNAKNSNSLNDVILDKDDPNYGWETEYELFNKVPYPGDNEIDFPSAINLTRDGETVYQFTNCGKTGTTGPSQTQANSAYSGGTLNASVTVSGGIQIWTVPATGDYKIETVGAAGGTQLYQGDYPGGKGASMSGEFSLTQGTVLKIIVGQKGENTRADNQDNAAPGGGGGSFVWLSSSNALLIAAGGGGGGGRNGDVNVNANTTIGGNSANSQTNGGTSGNGGRTNAGGGSYWAGGGAGWLSDGTGGNNSSNYNFNPGSSGAQGGRRPLNGGLGGVRWNDGRDEGGDGGFGGGGGGGSDNMGCGGGGGYSGGGGGNQNNYPQGNNRGGGAGSYNSSSTNAASSVANSGHGQVIITNLSDPNTPPTAVVQTVTINEDASQTITLAGNDDDNDVLTYAIVAAPSNGGTTISGNVVTYTPNLNYNGTDSFTFAVSDGGATSSPATVSITITAVNDAPTAIAQSVTGNEDAPKTITLTGSDVEGSTLTYTLATSSSNGTIALSGNVVTYTPSTNYNGTDTFTFTVSDGGLTSAPATINISIVPVNDAPTATTQSSSGNEDAAQTITLAGNDIDGDNLTYALASNSSNGSVSISGNVVTYNPNTNYNGTDSFTFKTSDGELTSSPATVNISIAAVNDAPVIASTPSLNAIDGSAYNYALTVNDVDGDAASVTATNKPDWLSFSSNGSSHILSGTPSLSNGGLHNIILSASDGNGGVAIQNYTLAVSLHSLEISGNSGFRIFSSPISGAVYSDLLDELWTQGAVGSDNPNSNPNIWTFTNDWNAVTNFTSDAITPGKGFLMYVYADTDFNGVDDLPKTISIDGTQSLSGVSVGSESSSWNLMGNPYGLSIGIKKMLEANGTFNSTVYTLDPNNPDAPYKFHNGTVGTIVNAEIKPFSGFWIKANENGNTFQYTEQSIRKGSLNAPERTIADGSTGYAEFTFINGTYTSTTYLSFTEEGEINLDPADADRLVPMSLTDHLTSMIYESNKSLAINNLPFDLTTDLSMDMDVMMLSPANDNGYATQEEQVDMMWDISNLPEGITLELKDNTTGLNVSLTENLSALISLPNKGEFSTSGGFMGTYPTVGESQFTLSVYGLVTASFEDDVLLPERLTLHDAYPNPFNPSTVISFDLKDANMVSLDIYDVSGRMVASLIRGQMIPGNHKVSWNPGDLSSGLYLINLVVGTETFNQKITYIK